jgi:hypothetical protein
MAQVPRPKSSPVGPRQILFLPCYAPTPKGKTKRPPFWFFGPGRLAWPFQPRFGAAIFAPAERPFAVHSHSVESVFGAPLPSELTMVSSGNRLLNAFDSATRERVDPFLEKIEVAIGDILCEAGGVLDHAYFPDGAVLSLQTVLRNGSAVETINIGRAKVLSGSSQGSICTNLSIVRWLSCQASWCASRLASSTRNLSTAGAFAASL